MRDALVPVLGSVCALVSKRYAASVLPLVSLPVLLQVTAAKQNSWLLNASHAAVAAAAAAAAAAAVSTLSDRLEHLHHLLMNAGRFDITHVWCM